MSWENYLTRLRDIRSPAFMIADMERAVDGPIMHNVFDRSLGEVVTLHGESSHEFLDELRAWCLDPANGLQGWFWMEVDTPVMWPRTYVTRCYFNNQNAALAFKMRWG